MTTQRRTPSIRVGDVAGLMASVDACPHRVWHTGRHSSLLRTGQPIEAEPAQGSVVRRLAAALERDHLEVYPSLRNGFEVTGSRSGARLKGRPDIITRDTDGSVTVYDVRDREPTARDVLRVKLAMYLLPRSNHGRWRGSAPSGCVLRPDGTEHRIDAGEIDQEFVERVAVVMRQLVSPEPATRVPGASECGMCPLTNSECAERIEPGPGHIANGSQDGLHDGC